MTEAHVMSIIKIISGVRERVKNPTTSPNVNAQSKRYVSTKKRNTKPKQLK